MADWSEAAQWRLLLVPLTSYCILELKVCDCNLLRSVCKRHDAMVLGWSSSYCS